MYEGKGIIMKRKMLALFMATTLVLSGCGSSGAQTSATESSSEQEETVSDETTAENTSESDEASTEENSEDMSQLEAIGNVDVDKGLFDVTINVPAKFIGDSTQEDLDKTAAEYGFKITLNDDGSATYVMTKSQHEKLMKEYADDLNASLAEMVESEDYPNITDIKVNSDFTSFTITTKNTEPDMAESMSTISLYMMAGVYNIFNGTPVENVHIDFVNADTGDIISSSDSADSGSDSE